MARFERVNKRHGLKARYRELLERFQYFAPFLEAKNKVEQSYQSGYQHGYVQAMTDAGPSFRNWWYRWFPKKPVTDQPAVKRGGYAGNQQQ